MKRLLCLLTFSLISLAGIAQLSFQKTYGGAWPETNDSPNRTTGAIATVPGAGYALAQTTQSFSSPQNPGNPSVYFLRLDLNGDTISTRTYENGGSCYGRSIYSLNDGGFVIGADMTGSTNSMALLRVNNFGDTIWSRGFSSQNGSVTGYFGMPLYDGGFVACGRAVNVWTTVGIIGKVDGTGNMVYGNSYQASTNNHTLFFYSSCESFDHGLLSTGYYYTNSAFNSSAFIMKTDSAGNVVWAKSYDGSADQGGHRIVELPDHSIMVTGYRVDGGFGDFDAFVLKTDADGNPLFEKIFGDSLRQWTNSMTLLPDGNIVLCGFQETANNYSDALLICIDQSGVTQWIRCYSAGLCGTDLGNSITTADDGGIAFTGFISTYSAGSSDVYFVKTDAAGNVNCHTNSIQLSEDNVQVTATARLVTTLADLHCSPVQCVSQRGSTINTLCTTVEVQETVSDQTFSVYPNPARDELMISGSDEQEVGIQIVNLSGQEILRIEQVAILPGRTLRIDVSNLVSGTYFVKVISPAGSLTQPLIISRNNN